MIRYILLFTLIFIIQGPLIYARETPEKKSKSTKTEKKNSKTVKKHKAKKAKKKKAKRLPPQTERDFQPRYDAFKGSERIYHSETKTHFLVYAGKAREHNFRSTSATDYVSLSKRKR